MTTHRFWARERRLRPALELRARAAGFALMLLAACASARHASVEAESAIAGLAERSSDPQALARALDAARIDELALAAPAWVDDPTSVEFWRAAAWAWSPRVRAARRAYTMAAAEAGDAGAPGPVMLEVRNEGFFAGDARTELGLTFDVLGVLGLGQRARARELAREEVRVELSELEEALWQARFEVEAARVRLAGARAREASLEQRIEEARQDVRRIEILAARGWIAPNDASFARAAVHAFEAARDVAVRDSARARAELGRTAGVPRDSQALDAAAPELLAQAHEPRDFPLEPSALELVRSLPALRKRLVECAVAEAMLQVELAERWPELRLGPEVLLDAGESLWGVMLELDQPWPGSRDGRIESARQDCLRSREALVDELLSVQARIAAARVELAVARSALDVHAPAMSRSASDQWRAARARFAVDAGALREWAMALEQGIAPTLETARAAEELLLARLELERLFGARDLARDPGEVQP